MNFSFLNDKKLIALFELNKKNDTDRKRKMNLTEQNLYWRHLKTFGDPAWTLLKLCSLENQKKDVWFVSLLKWLALRFLFESALFHCCHCCCFFCVRVSFTMFRLHCLNLGFKFTCPHKSRHDYLSKQSAQRPRLMKCGQCVDCAIN